jgi:hypothetical protein
MLRRVMDEAARRERELKKSLRQDTSSPRPQERL